MNKLASVSAVMALLALTTIFPVMTIPASASDRIRYECDAEGASDISISARYEIRSARRKFSVEFEAAPGLGFAAGDRLRVEVKGVRVGAMTLENILGGDVVGDVNFDTRPQPPDSVAFPAGWPTDVGRGSLVKIFKGTTALLGCRIQ